MRRLTLEGAALALASVVSIAAAAPQPGVHSIVGTYDCVVYADGRRVDHFRSVNVAWKAWVHVTTTRDAEKGKPPDVSETYVGFDADAKRWNIVGVDASGSYWTRHSTSQLFDGSRWIDDYPADGGTAIVRVRGSGAQYTFDLSLPKSNGSSDNSHVVCTRE
jgi:hypothetical protein